MNLITGITEEPRQHFFIPLDDGTRIEITLRYVESQLGWWMDLTYGTFELLGFRLVTSPNMLRQYANQLPFSLAVLTAGNREPLYLDDFASGVAALYLLDADDMAAVDQQELYWAY